MRCEYTRFLSLDLPTAVAIAASAAASSMTQANQVCPCLCLRLCLPLSTSQIPRGPRFLWPAHVIVVVIVFIAVAGHALALQVASCHVASGKVATRRVMCALYAADVAAAAAADSEHEKQFRNATNQQAQ